MPRYTVNNDTVDDLLSNIKSGTIAIPEMQRPFVWDTAQVRDLMDSLYKGFPVGYIIIWQNPDVKLKDGSIAIGKKVLIDGQQRITAMAAAIVGQEVLDNHYKWKRISIAFNPMDETFEVSNSANQRSSKWIPDIAPVFVHGFDSFSFVMEYCKKNDIPDQMPRINKVINNLLAIQNNSLGVITLAADLDIDSVTDIFIRINSKGVVLSQADFAMSTMAISPGRPLTISATCWNPPKTCGTSSKTTLPLLHGKNLRPSDGLHPKFLPFTALLIPISCA